MTEHGANISDIHKHVGYRSKEGSVLARTTQLLHTTVSSPGSAALKRTCAFWVDSA
jgi:hypothetical protein